MQGFAIAKFYGEKACTKMAAVCLHENISSKMALDKKNPSGAIVFWIYTQDNQSFQFTTSHK